ncbi:hypothetical protein C8R44DRAFT_725850 [Mycena epipterygia]|nr:hypothetical protein C8R44DRAFT_725850 [Mycena epipterygia]
MWKTMASSGGPKEATVRASWGCQNRKKTSWLQGAWVYPCRCPRDRLHTVHDLQLLPHVPRERPHAGARHQPPRLTAPAGRVPLSPGFRRDGVFAHMEAVTVLINRDRVDMVPHHASIRGKFGLSKTLSYNITNEAGHEILSYSVNGAMGAGTGYIKFGMYRLAFDGMTTGKCKLAVDPVPPHGRGHDDIRLYCWYLTSWVAVVNESYGNRMKGTKVELGLKL